MLIICTAIAVAIIRARDKDAKITIQNDGAAIVVMDFFLIVLAIIFFSR